MLLLIVVYTDILPPRSLDILPHGLHAPFLNIDNLPNARDIGPLPTATGHVKKGMLFRGPDLTRLTPTGIEAFTALGISTNFDLRSQQQLDRMGTGPIIPGVQRVWTPVFDERGYTEERAGERYRAYAGDGVCHAWWSGSVVWRQRGRGVVVSWRMLVMHVAVFCWGSCTTAP